MDIAYRLKEIEADVGRLLQAAMVRGALYETDGYPPAFASFFRFVNAGNVLLTALLGPVCVLGSWTAITERRG